MTARVNGPDGSSPRRDSLRPPGDDAAALVEDLRLAALHLRVGGLALARAELEDLQRHGALDAPGLANLAEARWRAGDLEGAAEAAGEHLADGGEQPIARIVSAEAAAAAGRPGHARAHADALGPVGGETLDRTFAGMPRRASWSPAPARPAEPAQPSTADGPGPAGHAPVRATGRLDEPADHLGRARDELGKGNADESARGVARLSLVLRLDPALAPAVVDALGARRDPAALLVFLGLGITSFSMSPAVIPAARYIVSEVPMVELRKVVARALRLATAAEIGTCLAEAYPALVRRASGKSA